MKIVQNVSHISYMMTAAILVINDIVQLYCCMRELIIWMVAVMTVQYLKVLYFQTLSPEDFQASNTFQTSKQILSCLKLSVFFSFLEHLYFHISPLFANTYSSFYQGLTFFSFYLKFCVFLFEQLMKIAHMLFFISSSFSQNLFGFDLEMLVD